MRTLRSELDPRKLEPLSLVKGPGAHDYGSSNSSAAQSSNEVGSVHPGHANVEDDNVRVDGVNHLQPLPAIAGFENLKVALEGHAVEGTPGRVIVYDQHLHH